MDTSRAARLRVALREITSATVREICKLDVAPEQQGLVAPNAISIVDHVRTLPGVTRFRTSYVPRANNASGLYERAGFRATGEVDEGEVVMELTIG